MKAAPSPVRVAQGFASMEPDALLEFADTVVTIAPQSPMYSNPVIKAGVDAVKTKAAFLKSTVALVATDAMKLANDKDDARDAQTALVTEVIALGALVQNNAKNESDVSSMAYRSRGKVTVSKLPPAVPDAIDVTIPRTARGYVTASVHETGNVKGRYLAEWTTEPMGTWQALTGMGKSRKVTGQSGAKIWVRFARVRGALQSDWCTPVLVTIP
jgi:hypothetical protein